MECETTTEDPREDFLINGENKCRRFGYGRFRPAFLQLINRPWYFLVVLNLYCIAQGTAILGIFLIVLPQIERRFSLTSTDIGLIAGSNDIAAVFFGIFISYYGDFANKIRWISFGGIVTALGLFLFTLPHFIAGRYHPPSTVDFGIKMCSSNSTGNNDCPEGSAVDWYYMAIFCISQFIAGAGVLPMYSMVPAYFEENLSKKLSPIYIALWNMAIYIGPLIGFALSDPLINLYVDITLPPGLTDLTSKDPRWIGNWWVGFLGSAGFLFLFSIILLGFPTHFQTDERMEPKMQNSLKQAKLHIFLTRLKEFLVAGKELMLNPVFVCNCLAVNIPRFVMDGAAPFFVKFLLMKYGISASDVGKAVAFAAAPGLFFGSLLGGFIVSKFNLKDSLKKSAFCCLIGQILVFFGPFAYLIPGCGNVNLAGLTLDYGEMLHNESTSGFKAFSKDDKFLQSSCNVKCGCTLQGFLPLCGADNISYLDPCHAGCKTVALLEPSVFKNCSCISPSTERYGGSAKLGFCDQDCRNWEWFLFAMALETLFFFLILIPSRIVVLRCVPENRQTFATGMQYFSLQIMANIPGPIVIGKLIDSSCEVWQHLCGKSGSCSVYDIDKMTLSVVLALALSFVFGAVLFFISWRYCDTEDRNYEITAATMESSPDCIEE